MATKRKVRPKSKPRNNFVRQVVMACECGLETTPSLTRASKAYPEGHTAPLICRNCRKGPLILDPFKQSDYMDGIKALLQAAGKPADVSDALAKARGLAEGVKSPFTISIRR
jgi:hypothetical protein